MLNKIYNYLGKCQYNCPYCVNREKVGFNRFWLVFSLLSLISACFYFIVTGVK